MGREKNNTGRWVLGILVGCFGFVVILLILGLMGMIGLRVAHQPGSAEQAFQEALLQQVEHERALVEAHRKMTSDAFAYTQIPAEMPKPDLFQADSGIPPQVQFLDPSTNIGEYPGSHVIVRQSHGAVLILPLLLLLLLLLGFGLCAILVIRAVSRKGTSDTAQEEARLVQEIHLHLSQTEKRIEALESALMHPGEGSPQPGF